MTMGNRVIRFAVGYVFGVVLWGAFNAMLWHSVGPGLDSSTLLGGGVAVLFGRPASGRWSTRDLVLAAAALLALGTCAAAFGQAATGWKGGIVQALSLAAICAVSVPPTTWIIERRHGKQGGAVDQNL